MLHYPETFTVKFVTPHNVAILESNPTAGTVVTRTVKLVSVHDERRFAVGSAHPVAVLDAADSHYQRWSEPFAAAAHAWAA